MGYGAEKSQYCELDVVQQRRIAMATVKISILRGINYDTNPMSTDTLLPLLGSPADYAFYPQVPRSHLLAQRSLSLRLSSEFIPVKEERKKLPLVDLLS
jgi:hypothetical protein